jgi:hypothetical protein
MARTLAMKVGASDRKWRALNLDQTAWSGANGAVAISQHFCLPISVRLALISRSIQQYSVHAMCHLFSTLLKPLQHCIRILPVCVALLPLSAAAESVAVDRCVGSTLTVASSTRIAASAPLNEDAWYFPTQVATGTPSWRIKPPTLPALTVWRETCVNDPSVLLIRTRTTPLSPAVSNSLNAGVISQNGVELGCFGFSGCVFEFARSQAEPGIDTENLFILPSARTSGFDASMEFTITFLDSFDRTRLARYVIPARGQKGTVAKLPARLDGLWHIPGIPGSGLALARNERGAVFAAWLTHADDGRPTWFAMLNGQESVRGTITGDVYQPSGPPFEGWREEGLALGDPVGIFTLRFTGETTVDFRYSVLGRTGGSTMERMKTAPENRCVKKSGVHLASRAAAGVSVNPIAGWAVAIEGDVTFRCSMHLVLLAYSPNGQPTWAFSAYNTIYVPGPSDPIIASGTTSVIDTGLYQPLGTPFGQPPRAADFLLGEPIGYMKQEAANGLEFTFGTTGTQRRLALTRFNFEY